MGYVVLGLSLAMTGLTYICANLQKRVRQLERDVAVLNRERQPQWSHPAFRQVDERD